LTDRSLQIAPQATTLLTEWYKTTVGSYASLTVDGRELFSTKSEVDPLAMTVFTESDRVAMLVRDNGEPASQALPPDWRDDSYLELPDDVRVHIVYRAIGRVVADRLEVMGVTLAVVRNAFERRLRERADEFAEAVERDDMPRAALAGLLREATFLDWSDAFRELMTLPAHPTWPFFVRQELRTEMMRFVAEEAADGMFFGLPGDARYLLRAVVEICGPGSIVEYDISDLVGGGWYGQNEPVAARTVKALRADARLNSPTIVLTEGSTDQALIEGALSLLAPHLIGYLTFMDFVGSNAPGGAAALVAAVKAFAGAGVTNRVIALFDNDAAGHAAVRTLARTTLPESIRIATLPDLPLARRYPTVGPSGSAVEDVNGRAGSIELYFGTDVLRDPDGKLRPVEWHALDRGVRRWQGELRDKSGLQVRFRQKLHDARADPGLLLSLDWNGMESVIRGLTGAFSHGSAPSIPPADRVVESPR
jgi:HEPN/Toprim N-terminal domain 1